MKKFFFSLLFSLLFFHFILPSVSCRISTPKRTASQVYDLVQDSIGYLWVATQGGGLARFDGHEFTVFNEKKGLQSNFVNSLLVSNDSLFVGTFSGLSIYSKGKFTNFESPKIHKIVMIDQQVYLATEEEFTVTITLLLCLNRQWQRLTRMRSQTLPKAMIHI